MHIAKKTRENGLKYSSWLCVIWQRTDLQKESQTCIFFEAFDTLKQDCGKN